MTNSIAGKTAIVTGAAHGIGLAIARHFVDAGANVVFADIDEESLEAEVGEAASREESVRLFAGDLRERLTIANLLSATIDAFDRVDILVNAQRQCERSDPLAPEDDAVDRLLRANMQTSLKLSQSIARRMIAQAEKDDDTSRPVGTIVNLSSIAATRSRPELMAYSISMAALDQMTRSLALALAPSRIRVNAVAFASVMSASLKDQMKANPDYRTAILSGTPLHRVASPSEVVEVAQFLASDASSFMTGQILSVDGGRGLLDPVAVPAH
jgi:7-alpha-hydroxysteroid dehydrogenase